VNSRSRVRVGAVLTLTMSVSGLVVLSQMGCRGAQRQGGQSPNMARVERVMVYKTPT